ncbi:hypothetical protein E0485_22620 [Paenibacillus albiflavus]|uniref:Uncharacterized protein n=1 Tax=Paenibacillus albiflavus TaxID=2545760 RepID=A0A4R4DZ87_9BACL|nr:hypothetical protein [Paenibacillus albiflavus]TCZ71449.1 hypothetical protein E0485_22620 [Paenibacillus albiflavus]
MQYIELARKLMPSDIPVHEVSLPTLYQAARLPTPSFWPDAKGEYTAGIMVPKMKIQESLTELQKWVPDDPYTYLSIENLLNGNKLLDLNESMSPQLYATFSILHELGHWYDFQDRYRAVGLSGKQYYSDYTEEQSRLNLDEITKQIHTQTRGSREQMDLLILYHETYRQHPFERIADQYAINNLRERNQECNALE